jgi:hypothetical protein
MKNHMIKRQNVAFSGIGNRNGFLEELDVSFHQAQLGYRLDDRGSRVRFPARAENFSLYQRV